MSIKNFLQNNIQQDGPSLESSSYLNVTLRYLGPLDLGTPGPWDSWTLGPLDHGTLRLLPSSNTSLYFLLHPLTSSSLLLFLPPTLLLWYGLVWGGVGMLSVDIGDGDNWIWSFDLYIDVKKLGGGGCT